MSKYRIVKRQISGYDPSYHFQKCHFGFIWITIVWTIYENHIYELAESYISKVKPDEFKILKEYYV